MFKECEDCAKKSGSPTLCEKCLKSRAFWESAPEQKSETCECIAMFNGIDDTSYCEVHKSVHPKTEVESWEEAFNELYRDLWSPDSSDKNRVKSFISNLVSDRETKAYRRGQLSKEIREEVIAKEAELRAVEKERELIISNLCQECKSRVESAKQ